MLYYLTVSQIFSQPKQPKAQTETRKTQTQQLLMKTKIVSFVVAMFALLTLSSCVPIRVGTFGPGQTQQYRPITGLPGQVMLARGGIVAGGCGPNSPYVRGGIQTYRVPQGWGQVNPYSNCGYNRGPYGPPMYPNRAGCLPSGRRQANWCPPFVPQPACYNGRTMRWF